MRHIGIVGSGITAAVTAMLLKQNIPNISIMILEKSKGTGGRMCTSRSPLGCSVDLGAQFITRTSNLSTIQEECYSQLLEAGLLLPLREPIEGLKRVSPNTLHYVCPLGSGSIVKHFLQKSDCDVKFGQRVTKLKSLGNKWEADCDNHSKYHFDSLILTLPVPQLLQLEGLVDYLEGKSYEKLKSVTYCSRFALGYFYDKDHAFFKNNSWSAKFIEDDVIRFYSLDHQKRGISSLPSVAVHTSKTFGNSFIDELNTSVVQSLIIKKVQQLFPEMPTPSHIKFHKWRYSQVENSYDDFKGCLEVSREPSLICGGDGFTHSTFEGCISSAESIVQTIIGKEI